MYSRDLATGVQESDDLCLALGIQASGRELISIVGGGGKSALLFALGRALSGKSVLTTTTRIFANQLQRASLSCSLTDPEIEQRIAEASSGSLPNGLLVIGEIEGQKARGVPADWPGRLLARDGIDFVIIEADGSRMRPAKAPAPHEPVIPEDTTLLIVVAGIDALAGPISLTCHRPERVCELLGVDRDSFLRADQLAKLMCHPQGGLKFAPPNARICLLINKVESPDEQARARAVAGSALSECRIDRVLVGALRPADRDCAGADLSLGKAPWQIYQQSTQAVPT
jgi:molybdenum cofactor cytidylyltransferase